MHPAVINGNEYSNKKIHNPSYSCRICGGKHGLRGCRSFLKMSLKQRMDAVHKIQCCWTCLAVSHQTNQCTSNLTCAYCDQMHNSLLHREPSPEPSIPVFDDTNVNRRDYSCRVCGIRHGLKDCRAFHRMSLEQRVNVVIKNQYCWICLAVSHPTVDCKSKLKCKRCGELHNTLLHGNIEPNVRQNEPNTPEGRRKAPITTVLRRYAPTTSNPYPETLTTSAPRPNGLTKRSNRLNTSQTPATYRNISQTSATRRNTSQMPATRRNTSQMPATRRNISQMPATRRSALSISRRKPNNPLNIRNSGNIQGNQLNPEIIAQTCLLLQNVQEVLRQL